MVRRKCREVGEDKVKEGRMWRMVLSEKEKEVWEMRREMERGSKGKVGFV